MKEKKEPKRKKQTKKEKLQYLKNLLDAEIRTMLLWDHMVDKYDAKCKATLAKIEKLEKEI